jgi:hypothetical protein
MRTTLLSLSAASGLVLLAALPASGRPVERFDYDVTVDPVTWDGCGFPVTEVARYAGAWMVKDSTPKTDGEYFRVLDRYRRTITLTNADEPAKRIVIEARGTFREGPGTIVTDGGSPLAGPTVEYRTKDSGAIQTVYDSDGKVLLRDSGTIVFMYVFDTGGDQAPGGGQIISEQFISASGKTPLFDMDDEQFCAALTGWIG